MTGAEAIIDIMNKVNSLTNTINELQQTIHFIEANIKILNNRAGGLLQQQAQPILAASNNLQLVADAPKKNIAEEDMFAGVPKIMAYKKVFGKLINNAKEPIQSALIKIYDKNNEVCATTETDPTGYWETMLKVGRYVAECTKPGFKPINKAFDIDSNVKEVEVK